MPANTRIHADSIYYHLGVQTFGLRIGIQLIKITHPHCQVGVGKELNGLRLREMGKQYRDILRRLASAHFLRPGPLQQKLRKHPCLFLLVIIAAYNYSRRMQVVI